MFVTNLPNGTSKETLKKIFSKFGCIVDVYIATKKDSKKKNFAFVRCKEVIGVTQLEASLQGLKCMGSVLEINVAKFKRRKVEPRGTTRTGEGNTGKSVRKEIGSLRDGRSFAEVIVGYDGRPIPPPPPKLDKKPIILESGSFWAEWIHSPLTLIGVAHSYEHLTNLPLEIRLGGSFAYGMKYLDGFEIGIRFRNDHDVKELRSNGKYWRKRFSELKPGNSYMDSPARLAWLKIVGLPLHMWSEGNFARIARLVGKLISPKMISMKLQDVSRGNICVLTERKTKINEEVVVDSNKKLLRVGIVEIDFD